MEAGYTHKPRSRFASACAARAFGATSTRDSAMRASDSIRNSLRSALRENKLIIDGGVTGELPAQRGSLGHFLVSVYIWGRDSLNCSKLALDINGSLKTYALSMQDKMAAGAFERARNYGYILQVT